MKRFAHAIAVTAALAFALASPATVAEDAPTVVELFTSQSCYSCPPAEAFLGELSARADVVALEFHVDYWDDLVYGFAGKWKDVFSAPEFTDRQQDYNLAIRRTGSVYTPQMVIDGRADVAGTRRDDVFAEIEHQKSTVRPRVHVAVSHAQPGGLKVALGGGAPAAAGVFLVRFLGSHVTAVRSGENKGKTLTNTHVVREVRSIGEWRGRPITLDVPDAQLADGEGCAVLVQAAPTGPILGAAACPAPTG
ncbi:MAG: DUF1223 domain-containing protein [Rhodospirillales bacterium]|jgi:hypothetical protein|nr:DUF1223 domain-containing protein [Rhodospirillales bacterium]MDP6804077.1 DUF1223 domain-containing protein [Rhodospirillales bacterium]